MHHLVMPHPDMQVLVYEPPKAMCSEWGVTADLGAKLMAYLSRTGWQVRAGTFTPLSMPNLHPSHVHT